MPGFWLTVASKYIDRSRERERERERLVYEGGMRVYGYNQKGVTVVQRLRRRTVNLRPVRAIERKKSFLGARERVQR